MSHTNSPPTSWPMLARSEGEPSASRPGYSRTQFTDFTGMPSSITSVCRAVAVNFPPSDDESSRAVGRHHNRVQCRPPVGAKVLFALHFLDGVEIRGGAELAPALVAGIPRRRVRV